MKARKLEGFLGHLLETGVQTVIIPLANVTNLGTDLAELMRRVGLSLRIVVLDDPPLSARVRAEIFLGLENEVELLSGSRLAAMWRIARVWSEERSMGRKVAVVPPSPGHPSAVIGAARGFCEMVHQCRELDQPLPRAVYVASAAGATAAGFVLAEAMMRRAGFEAIKIVPVQVAPGPLRTILPSLLLWTWRFLGFPGVPPLDGYAVARLERNMVYGRFDSMLEGVCRRAESEFGLAIDPIYGAKAWSAMEEMEGQAVPSTLRPPLFWHCGYTPGWERFRCSDVDSRGRAC